MRLENLYPNFGKSPPEVQAAFISAYRLRRATDLATVLSTKKPITVSKTSISLTDEEKAIMKLLGLKQKDVLALRSNQAEPVEDEKEAVNLFKEDTYEEEE